METVKRLLFYGFTALGMVCAGVAFLVGMFSMQIPWKEKYHQLDPNLGIHWPISWPWAWVIILGSIAAIAAANYLIRVSRS